MELFQWILNKIKRKEWVDKDKIEEKQTIQNISKNEIELLDDWEELPEYVDADPNDSELVAVIASSIAAEDYPESQFKIKSIKQRSPEAIHVSLIASAIAAETNPESRFIIKSIKRKK